MMVLWQLCSCGKPIDEYEESCHWCGRPKQDLEHEEKENEDGDVGE